MPSLKDIRRRIGSVKSTQKITRAMKLVAAAKLRRAQDSIVAARPYARELKSLISDVASKVDADDHPLLEISKPRRVMLIVLCSDRGLCGAFNTNVLRAMEAYRREHRTEHDEIQLTVVGRRGHDYCKYRGIEIYRAVAGLDVGSALSRSRALSDALIEDFLSNGLDAAYLVYNEFKSAMTQKISVERLLPIERDESTEGRAGEFVYEPDKMTALEELMPMYVEVEVYRAVLESIASELGARMTAMENATKNASEMISSLTLEYNKARQAAITKELLEIVAGAEAIKG